MNNPYQAPDAQVNAAGPDQPYQPKFLSFSGRIGRVRYLAYQLGIQFLLSLIFVPLMMAFGLAAGLSGQGSGAEAQGAIGALAILIYIPLLIAGFTYAVRRLHDLDKTGWLSLLFLVPLVNFILGLYILFAPGTPGGNRFGPPPAPNTGGVIFMAWLIPGIALLGIVAAILIPMIAAK